MYTQKRLKDISNNYYICMKVSIIITKVIAEIVLAILVGFLAVSCVGMLYRICCTTEWSKMTLYQGVLSGFTDVFLGTACGYLSWLLAKAMKKVWHTNTCEELFK